MRRALVLLLRLDTPPSPSGSFSGFLSSISNITGELRSPCRVGRRRALCSYAVDQFSDDEYECEFEDKVLRGGGGISILSSYKCLSFVSLVV